MKAGKRPEDEVTKKEYCCLRKFNRIIITYVSLSARISVDADMLFTTQKIRTARYSSRSFTGGKLCTATFLGWPEPVP